MVVQNFINESGTIGIIFTSFTNNVSGSSYLTLMSIILLVIVFFMIFRLPVEATAILILPMILIFVAYSGDLIGIGMVALLYVGFLFAKNFII